MIGIRAALSGALAVAVCAGFMPAGDAGPGTRLAADRLVHERAVAADAALADLERALEPALDAARRGAARMVAGDEPPGDQLRRASDAARDAEPVAIHAGSALERLDRARRARDPSAGAVEAPVRSGQLSSIAGQLDATAEAGDDFAAMRGRADDVTRSLEAALAALDARDLDAAEAAIGTARRDHDVVRGWDVVLATLPVWLETTDAMIGAMETIVSATRAGDTAAARAAAEAFASLQAEAAVADRALRIAVSEGGAAVAAAALGRLANSVRSVSQAREEVAVILQTEGR